MPNHITNTIKVKDMDKFRELAISVDEKGNEYVDFSKLVPMPNELKITSGSGSWEIDKYGWGINKDDKILQETLQPILDKIYRDDMTQDEFVKSAKKHISSLIKTLFKNTLGTITDEKLYKERVDLKFRSYYNLKKYGTTDWYDWSINNWGTKWNAYDCYINNDGATFGTAWSYPFEWLEKLAEHMDFSFSYADEDIGANFGIGKGVNGELISRDLSDDDLLDNLDKEYISVTIKGYDYDEHKDNQRYWYGDKEDIKVEILPTERQQVLYNQVSEYI